MIAIEDPAEIDGMPAISCRRLSDDHAWAITPFGMRVNPTFDVCLFNEATSTFTICFVRWSDVFERWRIRDDMHVWRNVTSERAQELIRLRVDSESRLASTYAKMRIADRGKDEIREIVSAYLGDDNSTENGS